MASLKDLVDHSKTPTEFVTVGDVSIPIKGISVNGIAYLLNKYEELRMLLSGKQVDVSRFAELGDEIVGALIAAGIGKAGDKEEEKIGASLPFELQTEFLLKIIKVTLPNGVEPFMERLNNLLGSTFPQVSVGQ